MSGQDLRSHYYIAAAAVHRADDAVCGPRQVWQSSGFQQYIHHDFDKTFLAGPLLDLFRVCAAVRRGCPGALVLMGLLTRPILALTALNLIVLFFGKWVVHDFQTAAYNSLYVLITIYALCRSKDNRFSLDYLICSCCCRGKKQGKPDLLQSDA